MNVSMKSRTIFLSIICFTSSMMFFCMCSKPSADESAARMLAERIVPEYTSGLVFRQLEDSVDVFELYSEDGKVVICGNNANSMAVGLNHYLKNHCGVTVSWYADEPVEYPSVMPPVDVPVRVEARIKERFFLNYCTFGYTMPWWKWEDWERLIDWMALNGVTMPLATTGQEAVWQKVWRSHGLTDEQIRSYFTGPAHLAWHRMSNIDGFDGPLPQGWIDAQVELQKKILERERSLNMRPVLPAFSGHVPPQLKDIYPSAQITKVKGWGGFPEENLCHFLAPMDSLYHRIQSEFLEEQTRLFGTDHIYGSDLFNEVEAPSWDSQTLSDISRNAYESMAAVDPEALWLQMGWMFYYDSRHWTPENISAYLSAVPRGKVMLLDYYLENTLVWKHTEGFYGQPYILCYLGNFGGNTRLSGHFRQTSERIEDTFANGGDNFIGIGSTLEGFGVNQFMFEYVFDKAWETGMTDDEWIGRLSDRRIGHEDPSARKVWKSLCDSIYVGGAFSSQTPLSCARPCLEGFWHWTAIHNVKYSNETLVRIWKSLLEVPSDRDTYMFDIVNIGTQALGNHFAVLRDSLTSAYRAGDLETVISLAGQMRELLEDIDALASCHPQFSLEAWLDDAASWGSSPEEEEYYRRNARRIISTWGNECHIRDYGTRQWSGFVSSYCAPRWDMFFDEIIECMETGKEYDQEAFFERCTQFENQWVENEQEISYKEPVCPVDLSRKLIERYLL